MATKLMTGPSTAQDHASLEILVDFLEGRLSEQERAAIEAHLGRGCRPCGQEYLFAQRLTLGVEAARWPLPPSEVSSRAIRAYRPPPIRHPSPTWPTLGRALAGALAMAAIVLGLTTLLIPTRALAASIVGVSGPVEVQAEETRAWQPAHEGQQATVGAALRTGVSAKATVVFPSGARLTLTENTEVRITELARVFGRWEIGVFQSVGQTENEVEPHGSQYALQTSAGDILAVGTRFGVLVGLDGGVLVMVREGAVSLTGGLGPVRVPAGMQAALASGQQVTIMPLARPEGSPDGDTSREEPGATGTNEAMGTGQGGETAEASPEGTQDPGDDTNQEGEQGEANAEGTQATPEETPSPSASPRPSPSP